MLVLSKIKNIFNRIPLLKGNSFQQNLILALAFITYLVVTIDLQTEMAIEKDEISSVAAVLDNTIDSTILDAPLDANVDFQFIGIISFTSTHTIQNNFFSCLKDRAPPVF
ncbi:MAG: hypothetical protein JST55_13465 [Bacteroidetes bacterium]|nr:hypothetical protein [Bacteroidota bacterium]